MLTRINAFICTCICSQQCLLSEHKHSKQNDDIDVEYMPHSNEPVFYYVQYAFKKVDKSRVAVRYEKVAKGTEG